MIAPSKRMEMAFDLVKQDLGKLDECLNSQVFIENIYSVIDQLDIQNKSNLPEELNDALECLELVTLAFREIDIRTLSMNDKTRLVTLDSLIKKRLFNVEKYKVS